MESSHRCQGNINQREDYELFDSLGLASKRAVTDTLDELFLRPDYNSFNLSDAQCDKNGVYLSRQYDLGRTNIDENESSIDKQLAIYYDKTTKGLSVETYEIIISYTVNQLGVEKTPIVSRYEISYFGEGGESTSATAETLDLTSSLLPEKTDQLYSCREMTAFDCREIQKSIDELAKIK